MTDERYKQLIALTKPPYNIDIYQVLMAAVQEATLHERYACARLVDKLDTDENLTDAEIKVLHLYSDTILARSNF